LKGIFVTSILKKSLQKHSETVYTDALVKHIGKPLDLLGVKKTSG
jgi:hypothetical protein